MPSAQSKNASPTYAWLHRTRWASLGCFCIFAGIWFWHVGLWTLPGIDNQLIDRWALTLYELFGHWKFRWPMPDLHHNLLNMLPAFITVNTIAISFCIGWHFFNHRRLNWLAVWFIALFAAMLPTAWAAPRKFELLAVSCGPSDPNVTSMMLKCYRKDHHNQNPPTDRFWDCMLKPTDKDGNVISANHPRALGPYMRAKEANPWGRQTDVAADTSAAWRYNERTGSFRAVVTAQDLIQAGYGEWDRNGHFFYSRDAYALRKPSTLPHLSAGENFLHVAWLHTRLWGFSYLEEGLPHPLIILIFAAVIFRCQRTGDAVKHTSHFLAAVSVLALLTFAAAVTAHLVLDNSFVILPAAGFASLVLLATWPMLLVFQFGSQKLTRAERGLCIACGYDLRGCVQAEDVTCPECGQSNPNSPLTAKA